MTKTDGIIANFKKASPLQRIGQVIIGLFLALFIAFSIAWTYAIIDQLVFHTTWYNDPNCIMGCLE